MFTSSLKNLQFSIIVYGIYNPFLYFLNYPKIRKQSLQFKTQNKIHYNKTKIQKASTFKFSSKERVKKGLKVKDNAKLISYNDTNSLQTICNEWLNLIPKG